MIKTIFTAILIGATVWLFAGCDNTGQTEDIEEIVLQGYLYVNKPMSVRLIRTVPLSRYYDPEAVGVSGAVVTIWEVRAADSTAFALTEDLAAPRGTYAVANPDVDDTVRSGRHYAIRIEAAGRTITAEIRSAALPIRVDFCRLGDSLLTAFRDPAAADTVWFDQPQAPFEIHWSEDSARFGVAFIIENIEPDWYADERELSGNNGPADSPIFIWTVGSGFVFEVPWIALNFEGRHRVRMLSCDEAAYKYFQSVWPAYPEMSPETNVRGALGIFCAIDADTAYFYLNDPDN